MMSLGNALTEQLGTSQRSLFLACCCSPHLDLLLLLQQAVCVLTLSTAHKVAAV